MMNKILNPSNNNEEPLSPTYVIEKKIYSSITHLKRGKQKIRNDKFKILSFNEYDDIVKYNYNIKQLKEICKHYKIKKTGNKDELVFRVYNFLKFSKYAVKIQSYYRGYLQRKLNFLRGPGFLKRSKCVNECDFCTLDELNKISYQQFFSFKSNNIIYGFDICSLYNYIKKFQKEKRTLEIPPNPYDRQSFPHEFMTIIKDYLHLSKIFKINLNIAIKDTLKNYTIQEQNKQLCLKIFQDINQLDNYANYEWFMQLNKLNIINFLKYLYDVWNHRASLSRESKISICSPYGNPFIRINIGYFTILHQQSLENVRSVALKVIDNIVNKGINDEFRKLGAYYVLGTLTLVNHSVAEALPWLYESFQTFN